MILGIPTYTVVRVLAREFFYNFKAVRKITSSLENDVSIPVPGNDRDAIGVRVTRGEPSEEMEPGDI
jgi:hypothetical protein